MGLYDLEATTYCRPGQGKHGAALDAAEQETPAEPGDRLSREEDDELRRLNWFSEHNVTLSGLKRRVFTELRRRDRREEIREPREFGQTETD